jgi:hypothetical protein
VHRSISALQLSEITMVILLGESFSVVFIQLDTSLSLNNPLFESGQQCRSIGRLYRLLYCAMNVQG